MVVTSNMFTFSSACEDHLSVVGVPPEVLEQIFVKYCGSLSGAVPVAVDVINSYFIKARQGDTAYNFSFVWRNSGCDPGVAVGAMSELLEQGVDVFVGPGCSAACEATQLLASNRHTAQVFL